MVTKTILVIEDESDLLTAIKMTLEGRGYRVHGFSDPSMALKHIKEVNCQDCSLVISDIKMPVMTGVELAIHFKRVRPEMKFMLMSAMSIDRANWRNILPQSEYVDNFIPKPFTTAELIDAVKSLEAKK